MRSQRGHALILTTILGIMALGAWAMAFLTTRDLVRVEKSVAQRELRDESVTRALATGVKLLRTGTPEDDTYACIVNVPAEVGEHNCTLQFDKQENERWSVEARISTEDEIASLPPVPSTFEE